MAQGDPGEGRVSETGTGQARRLRSVRDVPRMASMRAVAALILREMSTTYGRSPGGYLWAFLEPVLGIVLLVLIFSTGFRAPPLGTNFAIFYASGLLPFFTFIMINTKVAQAINFSKQLLAYPRVTYVDAIIARAALALLTQLLVSVAVYTGILVAMDTRTVLVIERLVMSYAMALSLGLGFGVLNCVIMLRFPIWQSIWGVVTRPLVLVSGVIFLPEMIPQPYRDWLAWNPLVHVTGEARRAFYYGYKGAYVEPVYVFGLSLGTAVLGLIFLRRFYRDLLER